MLTGTLHVISDETVMVVLLASGPGFHVVGDNVRVVGILMSMLSCFVPLPAEFVAVTAKLNVPTVVGMPEIVPVLLKLKPTGRLPDEIFQIIGVVPVALSVWL